MMRRDATVQSRERPHRGNSQQLPVTRVVRFCVALVPKLRLGTQLLEALLRPCSIPISSEYELIAGAGRHLRLRVAARPRFDWQIRENESHVMARSGAWDRGQNAYYPAPSYAVRGWGFFVRGRGPVPDGRAQGGSHATRCPMDESLS
jgi:hypothetical protein